MVQFSQSENLCAYIFGNCSDVEKFDDALLGADNRRLDYKTLIDRLTNQQLNALAEKYTKNPPASHDAWLDNINPGNAPIAE